MASTPCAFIMNDHDGLGNQPFLHAGDVTHHARRHIVHRKQLVCSVAQDRKVSRIVAVSGYVRAEAGCTVACLSVDHHV